MLHAPAGSIVHNNKATSGGGDGCIGGDGSGEPFTEVKPKRRRRHQHRLKRPTAASLQLIDQIIDAVASQGSSRTPPTDSDPDSDHNMSFSDTCSNSEGTVDFKNEIIRMQKIISTLQTQVDFLMSFVGITPQQAVADTEALADGSATNSASNSTTTTTKTTYAAAAATGIKGPMRNAVLTAMYSDLRLRDSMQNNIVVYGLPPNPECTDAEVFSDLCIVQLGYKPHVERTMRLGKPALNKIQPLLVALTDHDAKLLLSWAKRLRNSGHDYVRNHVYFSAQQTRAERQSAYEARCHRRQQNASRQQKGTAARTAKPRASPTDTLPIDVPVVTAAAAAPPILVPIAAASQHREQSTVAAGHLNAITTFGGSVCLPVVQPYDQPCAASWSQATYTVPITTAAVSPTAQKKLSQLPCAKHAVN